MGQEQLRMPPAPATLGWLAGAGWAIGALRGASRLTSTGGKSAFTGWAAGTMRGAAERAGALSSRRIGEGRPRRPRRWALPMTALRVTPPRRSAMRLAVWPWPHSRRSSSTRSFVQSMAITYQILWMGYSTPLDEVMQAMAGDKSLRKRCAIAVLWRQELRLSPCSA